MQRNVGALRPGMRRRAPLGSLLAVIEAIAVLYLRALGWSEDKARSVKRAAWSPSGYVELVQARVVAVDNPHLRARLDHRPAFVERVHALLDPRSDVHRGSAGRQTQRAVRGTERECRCQALGKTGIGQICGQFEASCGSC